MLGGDEPLSLGFIDKLLARRILPRVKLSYKVCRIPREAVEEYIRIRTINAIGGVR